MTRSAAESLGPVRLSDLRAHLARGAVIVVSPTLDLLEVAEVVARDDKARVATWIAEGHLAKPSDGLVSRWERAEGDVATSLVVQPFVLVHDRTG
jgi:hypothetical protein